MLEGAVQNFFSNPRNARKFGVRLAYLFGSATDDRFRARSDLDIGVLFKEHRAPYFILQNSALLQIELSHTTSRHIDLVILNFASSLLKREIIRGRNIFTEREATRIQFENQVIAEYVIFEKNLNREFKRQLRGLSSIYK